MLATKTHMHVSIVLGYISVSEFSVTRAEGRESHHGIPGMLVKLRYVQQRQAQLKDKQTM